MTTLLTIIYWMGALLGGLLTYIAITDENLGVGVTMVFAFLLGVCLKGLYTLYVA